MVQKKGKKRVVEAESTEKAVLASATESVKFSKKKKTGPAAQNGQQKVEKPVPKVVATTEAPAAKGAKNQKKKEQKVAKKQEDREKRTLERTEKGEDSVSNKLDTPETIKEKIAEIKSRDTLSKTAKRKLAVLTKKLKTLEGTAPEEASKKLVAKAEAVKGKNKQEVVKAKKAVVEETEVKAGKPDAKAKDAKKKGKQPPKVQEIKKPVTEEDMEEEEEDDEDDDVSEDEKELSMEVEAEDDDDDDVDNEEDDDDEEASDEEDEEDSAEDDDEDDDEDDVEEGEKPAAKSKKPEATEEQKKKPVNEDDKKKRYVLFVGKLPEDIDEETLRTHFMTKCSEITSIRIPKQPNSNKSRGFAYVEFSSNVDYEKGFSLHNSMLNGRRLNVQYSRQDKSNMSRQQAVAKNMKLHALSKAGKFGGKQNKFQRKPFQKRDNKPFHKPGQT